MTLTTQQAASIVQALNRSELTTLTLAIWEALSKREHVVLPPLVLPDERLMQAPAPPPAPQVNAAAHAAPVARALGRSRKQQHATAWERFHVGGE